MDKEYFKLTAGEEAYIREGESKRQELLSRYATRNEQAIFPEQGRCDVMRPTFSRDVDKIMYCPLYSRYSDKTQVLSFFKNDNITRRALHVQLVSKIARTIGRALRINCDLIEAIALGHDIGHAPFGHKGERYLSDCYQRGCAKAGRAPRYFNHNVQSARYFRKMTLNYDISLQTLSGIISHNGEKVCREYAPSKLSGFKEFDFILEKCTTDNEFHKTLRPDTLEGCVVRLSDIIAYIGKDRQDLYYADMYEKSQYFKPTILGNSNAGIISNTVTNIVKNSIDSPSLNMDAKVFEEFEILLKDNYLQIYGDEVVTKNYSSVETLMDKLYFVLRGDIIDGNEDSYVYKHHINNKFYKVNYEKAGIREHADDIVTDYISGMTDDYFIELCRKLHIDDDIMSRIKYRGYFDQN